MEDKKEEAPKVDKTPMAVEYKNGYKGIVSKTVAETLQKRGKLKILGPGKPDPIPKAIRDKMIKNAVDKKLGQEPELAALSDADLAALIKEA